MIIIDSDPVHSYSRPSKAETVDILRTYIEAARWLATDKVAVAHADYAFHIETTRAMRVLLDTARERLKKAEISVRQGWLHD